jgi:hypothetical protein
MLSFLHGETGLVAFKVARLHFTEHLANQNDYNCWSMGVIVILVAIIKGPLIWQSQMATTIGDSVYVLSSVRLTVEGYLSIYSQCMAPTYCKTIKSYWD